MNVQFQGYSLFWVFVCLILALGYSYLLYRSESRFNPKVRYTLAAIRAFLIFILSLFLFSPLITRKGLNYEKPIILFAQDNSASILMNEQKDFYKGDYLISRNDFINKLSQKFEVKPVLFGSEIKTNEEVNYSSSRTGISYVFDEVLNAYKNRNIAAIVLASDGIYNTGADPQSYINNIQVPVYSVLMGDSVHKRDVRISEVIVNKIVYKRNDFAAQIRINAFDLKGKNANVSITHKGKKVWNAIQQIPDDNSLLDLQSVLNASETGMQKYTVIVESLPGEKNIRNNRYDFFVEVMDARQQIAIIAAAPHPDLAALKQSIETNENYQADLFFADNINMSQLSKYQLLVLHQLPASFAPATELLKHIQNNKTPVWFIIGNQTYLDMFNRLPYGLKILSGRSNPNEVFPVLKSEFSGFSLTQEWNQFASELPPLSAPFGNYRVSNGMQTLMFQRVGSAQTEQPLLSFSNDGNGKAAILSAEGFWKWRIQNFKMKGNAFLIDEFTSKMIQYLSAKDDKRKFRVNMPEKNIEEGENILFRAELYNDSYELINTPDVKLIIRNEQNKTFNFNFSKTEKAYELNAGNLPEGEYSYIAETSLGNQKHEAKGSFNVIRLNLEEINTTADFYMMRNLSEMSGGNAFKPNQLNDLAEVLLKNDQYKTISYEEKRTDEWISFKSIFWILILLLSMEWLIRKYNGAY